MTHDEVLEACDKHRESQEGVGLSDELIRIVTFAYEQGWYAGCDLGLGQKTLNIDCDICHGIGWINSNNENWEPETQKCDACQVYKTDTEAQKAEREA